MVRRISSDSPAMEPFRSVITLVDVVDQWIRNQAKHHAKMAFKEEYRRICEKHEIEIDERYVPD